MLFTCNKHGEVEAEPNLNYDVYCPACLSDSVSDALADTVPPFISLRLPPPPQSGSATCSHDVCLHSRACGCSSCMPWVAPRATSGCLPSKALYIPSSLWEALGRPSTIEGYEEAARRSAASAFDARMTAWPRK